MALSGREGSEREQCHLLGSCKAFSHFPCYPQSIGLLVLIPRWVGLWVLAAMPGKTWNLQLHVECQERVSGSVF